MKHLIRPIVFVAFLALCVLVAVADMQRIQAPYASCVAPPSMDPGMYLLFSGFTHVLNALIPGHQASPSDVLWVDLTVLAVFSLVTLLQRIPLAAAVGAHVSLLLLWFMFRAVYFQACFVDAWTAVLSAVFLVSTVNFEGRRRDYAAIVPLGLVLSYLLQMRQSAQSVAAFPVLFVLGCCGLSAAVRATAAFVAKRRGAAPPKADVTTDSPARAVTLRRLIVPALILLACIVAVDRAVAGYWNAFERTPLRRHGVGWNLYLSLGMANNPYNIAYDDDLGCVHGIVLTGRVWTDNTPECQAEFQRLWWDRVKEDPALFLRSVAVRASYVVRYFSATLDPSATVADGYPLRPSWQTAAFGLAFIASCAVAWPMARRRRDMRLVALLAGTAGLFAAMLLPMLLVAPFYLGGAIACIAAGATVILPALGNMPKHAAAVVRPEVALVRRWLWCLSLAGLLVLLAIGTGYCLFRASANASAARDLITANIGPRLTELGERFAVHFNRLPVPDQERVLAQFLDPRYAAAVFRPLPDTTPSPTQAVFRTTLAFTDGRRIFVTGRMSDQWQMAKPAWLQGPRNSVLVVRADQDQPIPVFLYCRWFPTPCLKIADANWDGRYRMFVLPLFNDFKENTQFVNASVYNFRGKNPDHSLMLERVGGGRLYRGNLARNPP